MVSMEKRNSNRTMYLFQYIELTPKPEKISDFIAIKFLKMSIECCLLRPGGMDSALAFSCSPGTVMASY